MFSSLQAISFKMDWKDVSYFFNLLAQARYASPPFSEFRDWKDQNLWLKVLDVLNQRDGAPYIDLKTLTRLVHQYADLYNSDPSGSWITDVSFRATVISVLVPDSLKDKMGQLTLDLVKSIKENQGFNEEVAESRVKRSRVLLGSSSGNNLQLTSMYKDACHTLFFISI